MSYLLLPISDTSGSPFVQGDTILRAMPGGAILIRLQAEYAKLVVLSIRKRVSYVAASQVYETIIFLIIFPVSTCSFNRSCRFNNKDLQGDPKKVSRF